MPDRDLAQSDEGDTAWPSDFATRVDGRPVRMQVERRAMIRGIDQSTLLRSLDVPIVSPDAHPVTAASAVIERLAPAQQQQLESLGLVEGYGDPANGGRRQFNPLWTVKETWHWEQIFPAGRNLVVEHEYTPGAGGAAGTMLTSAESRQSNYGREQIARYCVDHEILAALDRIARRTGSEYPAISETWISYILTTGANWRAPIGDFRLVVDKGDPSYLVSFCGAGVRRISPTRFEMRRRNWRPAQDLHVLILRPQRYDE